ncbi:MAG: SDR family oxidoreductase [Rickettsiales bacterium]|nr:SDR family oxidoreductase [Rickettsiales bacterium]
MNKLALITGASKGIGFEIASILASKKCNLVLVSRNAQGLNTISNALQRKYGIKSYVFPIDLSEHNAAKRIFDFTEDKGIKIDYLINNAGSGLYGEHVTLNQDALKEMLQLNIISVSELCLLYGQHMKARKTGNILNIASTAAYQPTPFFAAYGASKSFVLNFSEALAKELEEFGVTVSCISPGPTNTEFFSNIDRKNIKVDWFNTKHRSDVRKVAVVIVEAMFAGNFSTIVGFRNKFLAFIARLASRRLVASIAKKILVSDTNL